MGWDGMLDKEKEFRVEYKKNLRRPAVRGLGADLFVQMRMGRVGGDC